MTDRSTPSPLLALPPDRQEIERRRVQEAEQAVRTSERETRRVMWQCVALSLAGVPIYVWSWFLTTPRMPSVAVTLAFVVSYGLPFFRWLAFHVHRSESFQ